MSSVSQQFVSKNDFEGLVAEAQNCSTRYDFQGATQLLERARKLDPGMDKLLVELGAAYAKGYNFVAADQCFKEAIRVSAKKADAINAVGHCWLDVRHYDAARECFEQLLQFNPPPAIVFMRLSEIYTRMRKVDQASEMADRAMKLYPVHEASLLTRAKAYQAQKKYDLAERLYRTIVSIPDYQAQGRASAWYELASILDQQGRYDEAMKACLEAKSLMRLIAGPALKILPRKQHDLKRMAAMAKGELVQRWRKAGKTDLQPERRAALLCGHARSGTTLLEYVVDSHPGVVSADETMVYHNVAYYPLGKHMSPNTEFVSMLDWLSPREMRQIRSDYFRGIESYLGEPIGNRLLLDKNPANTFDIPSVLRIFPDMKFLMALRDPRDVCLSCFMQAVSILPDTSSWLTLEGTITHYTYIMGLWAAWKPYVGDMALEVRYEDMVENQEATSRRVLEFLGLPWDDKVLKFHEHAQTKIVRSPTFAEVGKPIYKSSVSRWRNYQKYFEPHLEKLEPLVKAFGYA
jgi:tetratricopeptide (TPR) repeat protein